MKKDVAFVFLLLAAAVVIYIASKAILDYSYASHTRRVMSKVADASRDPLVRQSFPSAQAKAINGQPDQQAGALLIDSLSTTGNEYKCYYSIQNQSLTGVDFTVRAEVQERLDSGLFRGFMALGSFPSGYLESGQKKNYSLGFQAFERGRQDRFRIQLQLYSNINGTQQYLEDYSLIF